MTRRKRPVSEDPEEARDRRVQALRERVPARDVEHRGDCTSSRYLLRGERLTCADCGAWMRSA